MADKSKKNVYRKTMGFNHNRVKTTVEMVTNATKGLIADVKHSVQQYGSNNSVIGSKEPHKKISNANMGTFKRPPYKKNKFKGAKDGYEKNSLGSYGNRKDNPEIFTMIGKARRKLVKGT